MTTSEPQQPAVAPSAAFNYHNRFASGQTSSSGPSGPSAPSAPSSLPRPMQATEHTQSANPSTTAPAPTSSASASSSSAAGNFSSINGFDGRPPVQQQLPASRAIPQPQFASTSLPPFSTPVTARSSGPLSEPAATQALQSVALAPSAQAAADSGVLKPTEILSKVTASGASAPTTPAATASSAPSKSQFDDIFSFSDSAGPGPRLVDPRSLDSQKVTSSTSDSPERPHRDLPRPPMTNGYTEDPNTPSKTSQSGRPSMEVPASDLRSTPQNRSASNDPSSLSGGAISNNFSRPTGTPQSSTRSPAASLRSHDSSSVGQLAGMALNGSRLGDANGSQMPPLRNVQSHQPVVTSGVSSADVGPSAEALETPRAPSSTTAEKKRDRPSSFFGLDSQTPSLYSGTPDDNYGAGPLNNLRDDESSGFFGGGQDQDSGSGQSRPGSFSPHTSNGDLRGSSEMLAGSADFNRMSKRSESMTTVQQERNRSTLAGGTGNAYIGQSGSWNPSGTTTGRPASIAPSTTSGALLDNSHLRPGVQAALLSHNKTLELYRMNAKKTNDPDLIYEFSVFMIDASKTMPDTGSMPSAPGGKDEIIKEATGLLKKIAERGHPDAQYFLADCYANGIGTNKQKQDFDRAYPLFVLAAKHGHPDAAYRAGTCYEKGWGCRRDSAKALQFYRKAAAQSHPGAMYRLATAELNGELGLKKSAKEGVKWLKRSAESATPEFPHALHELALLHERGIDNVLFVDPEYSCELLAQAAEMGYAPSAYKLGVNYEYGRMGCPQDAGLSIHMYNVAAQQNHKEACFALTAWYLVGAPGILPQSDTEAYLWAKKAAEQELAKAEYAVGYFTEMGIGTVKDLREAKAWLTRAAEHGDKRANQRLIGMGFSAVPVQTDVGPTNGKKSKSKDDRKAGQHGATPEGTDYASLPQARRTQPINAPFPSRVEISGMSPSVSGGATSYPTPLAMRDQQSAMREGKYLANVAAVQQAQYKAALASAAAAATATAAAQKPVPDVPAPTMPAMGSLDTKIAGLAMSTAAAAAQRQQPSYPQRQASAQPSVPSKLPTLDESGPEAKSLPLLAPIPTLPSQESKGMLPSLMSSLGLKDKTQQPAPAAPPAQPEPLQPSARAPPAVSAGPPIPQSQPAPANGTAAPSVKPQVRDAANARPQSAQINPSAQPQRQSTTPSSTSNGPAPNRMSALASFNLPQSQRQATVPSSPSSTGPWQNGAYGSFLPNAPLSTSPPSQAFQRSPASIGSSLPSAPGSPSSGPTLSQGLDKKPSVPRLNTGPNGLRNTSPALAAFNQPALGPSLRMGGSPAARPPSPYANQSGRSAAVSSAGSHSSPTSMSPRPMPNPVMLGNGAFQNPAGQARSFSTSSASPSLTSLGSTGPTSQPGTTAPRPMQMGPPPGQTGSRPPQMAPLAMLNSGMNGPPGFANHPPQRAVSANVPRPAHMGPPPMGDMGGPRPVHMGPSHGTNGPPPALHGNGAAMPRPVLNSNMRQDAHLQQAGPDPARPGWVPQSRPGPGANGAFPGAPPPGTVRPHPNGASPPMRPPQSGMPPTPAGMGMGMGSMNGMGMGMSGMGMGDDALMAQIAQRSAMQQQQYGGGPRPGGVPAGSPLNAGSSGPGLSEDGPKKKKWFK